MSDDSGLVADYGTTFMLQKHYFGAGLGKLVILNDGDFAWGAAAGVKTLPTFVNRGRIAKRGHGPHHHPGPATTAPTAGPRGTPAATAPGAAPAA